MQRFCTFAIVLAATAIAVTSSSEASAQGPAKGVLAADSELRGYAGMYIGSTNHVRIANSRQFIPLDEATADLAQAGRQASEIRQVVQVMRKRMNTINAELRGSELGAARIRTQQITLRRTIRNNERYHRYPTDNDSERVEQSERSVRRSLDGTSQLERSSTVRLSPDEERGPVATSFAGIWVRPSRYASLNYDPALVKASLSKVESRLEKYDETIQELKAMKAQVAKCIILLDGELRNRSEGTGRATFTLTGQCGQDFRYLKQKPQTCTSCNR